MGVLNLGVLKSSLPFLGSLLVVPAAFLLNSLLISPAQAQTDDGIAWLQKDMNCDTLTVEMKRRYSTLGNFSQLTEAKRQEVSLVLDIICGARFAHCGFKNCQKLAPVSQPQAKESAPPAPKETPSFLEPLPPPPPPIPAVAIDFPAEAKKMLEEKIRKHQEFLKIQIAKAVEQENSEKRTWVKVSVALEEEVAPEEDENSSGALFPPGSEDSAAKNTKKNAEAPKVAPPSDTGQRRPRLKPEFAPAAPATPMMDLPVPGTLGRTTGKYLPKSNPEYHKIRDDSFPSFEMKSNPK